MDQEASVYALYPEIKKCNVFGEQVDEPFPSAKTIEGIIIKRFEKEYGKKPIGCTQK